MPLDVKVFPSRQPDASVTVCFHGWGGDYQVAEMLRCIPVIKDHLISFNLPFASSLDGHDPLASPSLGTIQELIPIIQVLNGCIEQRQLTTLNLYGFSAGGGVIVDLIAVLHRSREDQALAQAGITLEIKRKILQAIEKGLVVLECPLKSVEEVMAFHGYSALLDRLARKYRENHLCPLEAINDWKGLALHVLLYFQVPDEILSNRDDHLFAERLKQANSKGKTIVLYADEGGHNRYHPTLWKAYQQEAHYEALP